MRRIWVIGLIFMSVLIVHCVTASNFTIKWQRPMGGVNNENLNDLQPTHDGGYIIVGGVNSDIEGLRTHGGTDIWVIKDDASGNIEWQKALGGRRDDTSSSIQATSDGGYILSGATESSDGDVSGNHGKKDGWVVKLDSMGKIQWQKCIGGSLTDGLESVKETGDGGYILTGYTNSDDGDIQGKHGYFDIIVVKLQKDGALSWIKCLGNYESEIPHDLENPNFEIGSDIIPSSDGGYLLSGTIDAPELNYPGKMYIQTFTSTSGEVTTVNHSATWTIQEKTPTGETYVIKYGPPSPVAELKISPSHGKSDAWFVKLDQRGSIQWDQVIGGLDEENGVRITPTGDGGYFVGGDTFSNDAWMPDNKGHSDIFIEKISQSGEMKWKKILGGQMWDSISAMTQTTDGGIMFVGTTNSNSGDVAGNHGKYDIWVVKLGPSAEMKWQKCIGGTNNDAGSGVLPTTTGGFVVGGTVYSNDGDISGNHGGSDAWIAQMEPESVNGPGTVVYETPVTQTPNIEAQTTIQPPIIRSSTTTSLIATTEPTQKPPGFLFETAILGLMGFIYFAIIRKS